MLQPYLGGLQPLPEIWRACRNRFSSTCHHFVIKDIKLAVTTILNDLLEFQICAPKLGWVAGSPSESQRRGRKTLKPWTPNSHAPFATTKSLVRSLEQQLESFLF